MLYGIRVGNLNLCGFGNPVKQELIFSRFMGILMEDECMANLLYSLICDRFPNSKVVKVLIDKESRTEILEDI